MELFHYFTDMSIQTMFPSHGNQSVYLQSKSTDWFLYDGKTLAVKGLKNCK